MDPHNIAQLMKLLENKVMLVLSLEEFQELRLAAVPNLHIEMEETDNQLKHHLLHKLASELHRGPRKGGEVIMCGAIN